MDRRLFRRPLRALAGSQALKRAEHPTLTRPFPAGGCRCLPLGGGRGQCNHMPAIGLPVESVTVTRTAPAKPKPNKRRAHVSIDKRYAVGRRYKQLAGHLSASVSASTPTPIPCC